MTPPPYAPPPPGGDAGAPGPEAGRRPAILIVDDTEGRAGLARALRSLALDGDVVVRVSDPGTAARLAAAGVVPVAGRCRGAPTPPPGKESFTNRTP